MGRDGRAVGRRPVVVRGVRPVPPPLPDVPADRRGVGVAARADRRHAFGRRGNGRGRRHVRDVHGPVPGVSRVRGRLSVARAVRPDDGARARPGGTAPHPPRAVPAVARTGRRAPPSRAPADRDVPPADRPAVPAAPHARARAAPDVAVRAAAANHGTSSRERTSAEPSPSSPGACRTGGSTRSTAPRSACWPATAGAWSFPASNAAAERSPRTTDGSTRPAGSRVATRARSPASIT